MSLLSQQILISAFWHGFYTTYYIFFFLFFIYQNANEKIDKLDVYKNLRSKNNLILKLPVWIFNQFMCNALGTIIFNLRFDLFIQFLKNTYFSPIIIVFILYIATLIIKFKSNKTDKPKNENESKKLNQRFINKVLIKLII